MEERIEGKRKVREEEEEEDEEEEEEEECRVSSVSLSHSFPLFSCGS